MTEKHCKLLKFLFMVTTVLLLGVFMLTTSQAFADNGYKGKGKQKEWQNQRGPDKEYRTHRSHYEKQHRRDYRKRPDYHKHPGYRERPYDKHRHYGQHIYRGHRYDYYGHWRSWDNWDRYARRYPHIHKYGSYYREGGHLMFRFCEPSTGNFFFFSIGR